MKYILINKIEKWRPLKFWSILNESLLITLLDRLNNSEKIHGITAHKLITIQNGMGLSGSNVEILVYVLFYI